jgi:hypothetical protein
MCGRMFVPAQDVRRLEGAGGKVCESDYALTPFPNFVLFRSRTSCVCGLQDSIGTERSAQEGNEVCREKASEPPMSGSHPGSPSL